MKMKRNRKINTSLLSVESVFDTLKQLYIEQHEYPDPEKDLATELDQMLLCNMFRNKRDSIKLLMNAESITFTIFDKLQAIHQIVTTLGCFATLKPFFDLLLKSIETNVQKESSHATTESSNDITMSMDATDTSVPSTSENRELNPHVPGKSRQKSQKKSSDKRGILLNQRFKVPELNKIQKSELAKSLKSVQTKFPHYSACLGCAICDEAFTKLNVTWCSKNHGGDPCNLLGLYPHANATYLAVAHATRKVAVSPKGYMNPLSQEETPSEQSSVMNLAIKNNGTRKRTKDTLADYTNAPMDYTKVSDAETTFKRVQRAQHWRLYGDSDDSAYVEARKYFGQLKKYVPNYVVPTWATCASKTLFLSDNVLMSKDAGRRVLMKNRNKRQKRLNKRVKI